MLGLRYNKINIFINVLEPERKCKCLDCKVDDIMELTDETKYTEKRES